MRAAPFYLIFAAIVISVNGEESTNYFGRRLEPVEVAADQETISYLLPRLASKYRPNGQWSGVTDPRFYVLTEMDSNAVDNQEPNESRSKRGSLQAPSLSIVNSLDVLRNRLLLEIARKKAMEGANRNRQFLTNLGKRSMINRNSHNLM